MTVEEFARQLEDYGEQLSDFDGRLQQFFSQQVDQIRAMTPVDTGQLKSSIKLTGDRFGYQIRMNYYGVFQNYGVKGVNSSRFPVNLPEAGLSIGNVAIERQQFQFGTQNFGPGPGWGAYYTGIRARSFFSITDITNELTEFIQNNTEL